MIRYTNHHDIPLAVFRAITEDHKSSAGRYSITQLLAPPRIRRLLEQHDVEIDVSDRLWAILGKSMHALIERYSVEPERQLVAELDGVMVSGTIDDTDNGMLRDWKMTSTFTGAEGREEWVEQLNCYAWLCRNAQWIVARSGKTLCALSDRERIIPTALAVTMIYRDWSAGRAKTGATYPKSPVVTIDIPMWEDATVEAFLRDRLAIHTASQMVDLPPLCTEHERWHRADTWAVVKAGRKTAVRVLDSASDAAAYAAHNSTKAARLTVEHRPGTDVRCEGYCAARTVCPHGIAIAKSQKQSDTTQPETQTPAQEAS